MHTVTIRQKSGFFDMANINPYESSALATSSRAAPPRIKHAIIALVLVSLPTILCWSWLEFSQPPQFDDVSDVVTPNPAKAPFISRTRERMCFVNPRHAARAGRWTNVFYGTMIGWPIFVALTSSRWRSQRWLALVSMSLDVAHSRQGDTRFHFGMGVTFK